LIGAVTGSSEAFTNDHFSVDKGFDFELPASGLATQISKRLATAPATFLALRGIDNLLPQR